MLYLEARNEKTHGSIVEPGVLDERIGRATGASSDASPASIAIKFIV